MKLKMTLSAITLILPTSMLMAQHSDVELGYDDAANPTTFVIEQDARTVEGYQIFESEFETLDPFNSTDFSSDEPGFVTSAAEGLIVGSGDQIWLTALDAQANSAFGVGYVNYYNPATQAIEAAGRISVLDNSSGTADLVLNGASIESGGVDQFIDSADSIGDIHDHVLLDLLDDSTAPLGAYGIMFQLQSQIEPGGDFEVTSDPFWIVWNHGLTEENFDSVALPKFGVTAVPEPGSLSLMLIFGSSLMMARRRSNV